MLRTAGSFEKETSAGVAVASKPPYSFPRAFGSKNGGLEATATIFLDNSLENFLSNFRSMVYVPYPSEFTNEVSG